MIVAFSRDARSFADRAVQVATRSRYSHCELVFSNGMWFSATFADGKVVAREFEPTGQWEFLRTDCNESIGMRYATEMLGAKYDYAGAARFILPIIPQNQNRWFCSEICACILSLAGQPLEHPPHCYTPGRLREALRDKTKEDPESLPPAIKPNEQL